MNALVMAGGAGTRMLLGGEKLLLDIKGEPMIMRTIGALVKSGLFDSVTCATSANSPATEKILKGEGIKTMRTAGLGYSADLGEALGRLDGTIMIVSGDMPSLDVQTLQDMARLHARDSAWTSYVMTEEFAAGLGMRAPSAGTCGGKKCVHTGAMVVDASKFSGKDGMAREVLHIMDRQALAVNVNTKKDYELLGRP